MPARWSAVVQFEVLSCLCSWLKKFQQVVRTCWLYISEIKSSWISVKYFWLMKVKTILSEVFFFFLSLNMTNLRHLSPYECVLYTAIRKKINGRNCYVCMLIGLLQLQMSEIQCNQWNTLWDLDLYNWDFQGIKLSLGLCWIVKKLNFWIGKIYIFLLLNPLGEFLSQNAALTHSTVLETTLSDVVLSLRNPGRKTFVSQ